MVLGRRLRAGAVVGHEEVELLLVLGMAQAVEEFAKLLLLVLKAPQRLHAAFVESAVAARRRPEGEAMALHTVAHPLHLVLHPLHLVAPAVLMIPAAHFSAPECEKEKGKTDRPPDEEAEYRYGDPPWMPGRMEHMRGAVVLVGRAAPSIDISGVGHFLLHHGRRRCECK